MKLSEVISRYLVLGYIAFFLTALPALGEKPELDFKKDYFAILNVPIASKTEEITWAYGKLSYFYLSKSELTQEEATKLNQIKQAFEVLRDPYKRSIYEVGRKPYITQGAHVGPIKAYIFENPQEVLAFISSAFAEGERQRKLKEISEYLSKSNYLTYLTRWLEETTATSAPANVQTKVNILIQFLIEFSSTLYSELNIPELQPLLEEQRKFIDHAWAEIKSSDLRDVDLYPLEEAIFKINTLCKDHNPNYFIDSAREMAQVNFRNSNNVEAYRRLWNERISKVQKSKNPHPVAYSLIQLMKELALDAFDSEALTRNTKTIGTAHLHKMRGRFRDKEFETQLKSYFEGELRAFFVEATATLEKFEPPNANDPSDETLSLAFLSIYRPLSHFVTPTFPQRRNFVLPLPENALKFAFMYAQSNSLRAKMLFESREEEVSVDTFRSWTESIPFRDRKNIYSELSKMAAVSDRVDNIPVRNFLASKESLFTRIPRTALGICQKFFSGIL